MGRGDAEDRASGSRLKLRGNGGRHAGGHSRVIRGVIHPLAEKPGDQLLTLVKPVGAGRADGINLIVPAPGDTQ